MTPPRIARWLLRAALPADVRDDISGDLDERCAREAAESSRILARWRYRRRAAAIAARFAVERVSELRGSVLRFRFSLLDVRLALRMLARHPLLSIVGVASLALAIALGASVFALLSMFLSPRIPLPESDRIVTVSQRDEMTTEVEGRITAEFVRWRSGTETLTDFAATRAAARNLMMGDGIIEPVTIAEVTASMFPMTRVAPIAGRTFSEEDMQVDAPPVMVIGERLWRERFASDPSIVGKALLIGDTPAAVIGVMPAAYRFPSVYEVWQPLKLGRAPAPRTGSGLSIWARLKPGVTREQAVSELTVLSAQAARDWPATHAHLKAELGQSAGGAMRLDPIERLLLGSVNLGIGLLVLLISGNVALLMFARAATRESEIIVRSALGASRARLLAQFFAESLVLSAIAAVVGLALARKGVALGVDMFAIGVNDGRPLPFWITPELPPISIAYGLGLALFAAAITGLLPALKITRGLSTRLRETTAGGGGLKFGGVWTVLIVSQIAVTVTLPAVMFFVKRDAWQIAQRQIGVPAEQYLTARLLRASDMTAAQFEAGVRRVRENMGAVSAVGSVTIADKFPLTWNGHYEIEVDEGGAAPTEGEFGNAYRISTAAVEPDFFAAFDAAPTSGRLLLQSDYAGTARSVVVNQPFVDRVLGGRSAVGRRIRYTRVNNDGQRPPLAAVQPWLEIVGVVRDLGMASEHDPKIAGVYIPLHLRENNAVYIGARVAGNLTDATNALRSITARVDPALRLADVRTLDHVADEELKFIDYWTRVLAAITLGALVLSLSGIYAVMSFAVSRRTREIGLRVALGSRPAHVVFAILRRPLTQVAAGILCGGMLTLVLSGAGGIKAAHVAGLAAYICVMVLICSLAAVVPARRALRVDPIEALRTE